MKKIGVVFPYVPGSESLFKRIFKRAKYETVPVKEYGFEFLCVRDNQNCSKIFNKNGVENIVLMTDKLVERCNFRILDGERMFKKMLPEFVRKTVKTFERGCSLTLVDRNFSKSAGNILEDLCAVCGDITVSTCKKYDAERLCDRLLDKLGTVVKVVDEKSEINSDIAVVLEDFGNSYGEACIVIDKNCKRSYGKAVNDFHIPFKVKPPFGMSNLVFAECVEAIGTL